MKPKPEFYSSHLSRFCAEQLPGDFHFMDLDEVLFRHSSLPVVYARESGVLRAIESKLPGEQIRRSQRETLPLVAAGVGLLVKSGLLAQGSGAFVVEGEPPWNDGAIVHTVRAAASPRDWSATGVRYAKSSTLTFSELCTFIRCRPVTAVSKAAA